MFESRRCTDCREHEYLLGRGIVENRIEDRDDGAAGGEHRVGNDNGVCLADLREVHVLDGDRKGSVGGHAGVFLAAGRDDALSRTRDGIEQSLDKRDCGPQHRHNHDIVAHALAGRPGQGCLHVDGLDSEAVGDQF